MHAGANATRLHAQRFIASERRIGRITELTAEGKRSTLRAFAELAPDASVIGRRSIERWMKSVHHLAPATQRTRYSTVRQFTAYLVRQGVIRKDPCAAIPSPKVPRPIHRNLSTDHVTALTGVCGDDTDLLIVMLAVRLGLRRKSIAGLEMGDLHLGTEPTLDCTGKADHRHQIPIPTDVLRVLVRYIDTHGITAGPLIRLRRYPERGVSPTWVGRRFTELAYEAGIKARPRDGVSTHAGRHTAATRLWEETGDAALVAEVLGHSGMGSVRRYIQSANLGRMRAALEASGGSQKAFGVVLCLLATIPL